MIKINENITTGNSSWVNWAGVRSTTDLSDNTFYYVGGVKMGNTLKIYINGTNEGQLNALDGVTVNTEAISNYKVGYYFNGLIDEVRIYNRALSDAEIQAIYNATK